MKRLVLLVLLLPMMLAAVPARAQSDAATKASLERWLAQARSSDRATRERASDALVALGAVAVPGVLGLATDPAIAEDVRIRQVVTLGRLADEHDEAIPALITLVRRDEQSTRRAAMNALGHCGERAAKAIIAELEKPEGREVMLKALGYLGADAAPHAKSILRFLGDPDEKVRDRTVRVLGRMGQAAAPAVAEALRNPKLRLGAIEALGVLGSKARDEAPRLVDTLDDPSAEVRVKAVKALANVFPDPEVGVPALIDRLVDPDPAVRAAAASALSRYGEDVAPARDALIRAVMEDEDKTVRKEAVLTLRNLADLPLVPTLAHAANDVAGGVANAAVRSLHEMGEPAYARLEATLRDKNSGVAARAEAAGALGRLAENPALAPKNVLPVLASALRDQSEQVRRAAGKALGQLGEASVPTIVDALSDERRAVRLVALGALWDVGPRAEAAVPRLAQLVADPDRDVRLAAMDVLAGLGTHAAGAVPALSALLRDDETWFRPWWRSAAGVVHPTDVKLAAAAAHVLGAIGPAASEAAGELARALSDEDPALRAEAAEGLRRIGVSRQDVLDRLRIASDDDDAEVRRNARRALTELTSGR